MYIIQYLPKSSYLAKNLKRYPSQLADIRRLISLHWIRFTMVCLVDYQKWLKDGENTLKKTKKLS